MNIASRMTELSSQTLCTIPVTVILSRTPCFSPQNAVHNIVSVPKKPAKIVVDTVGGDKLNLEPSGLEPKFVHKKVNNYY